MFIYLSIYFKSLDTIYLTVSIYLCNGINMERLIRWQFQPLYVCDFCKIRLMKFYKPFIQ